MTARTALLATFLAVISAMPGSAQTPPLRREVPESRDLVQLSFAPVVKRVAPAVVNVYGTAKTQRRGEEFFERFFGEGLGAPERAQRSLGSGVIVDAAGLVVTNNHVIQAMDEVKVTLSDRREFDAEIVLRDPRTDLAVLRLKGQGPFPVLPIGDPDGLEVGDLVLALGNPFGVGQTVTSGIVSALARTTAGGSDTRFFIQTDAAINPGNSGGALTDMAGRLVGINTMIYSRSGGSVGIGFAIPANMVTVVLASAKLGSKTVKRPYFGASVQTVTADMIEALGLTRPQGVLVSKLPERGPAAEAGLKRGDVIIAIDGVEVDNPDAFGFRLATKPIGGFATLTILRGSRRSSVEFRLAAAPETRPRDTMTVAGRNPFAGLTIMALSPAVADELGLEVGEEGVVVAEIDPRGFSAQFGFAKGDVILSVNDQRIDTPRELDRAANARVGQWQVTVKRGGQVFRRVLG